MFSTVTNGNAFGRACLGHRFDFVAFKQYDTQLFR